MKRRSKLSIQVYRAITVTAIGLIVGQHPMRVMTVRGTGNREKSKTAVRLSENWTYQVFGDSSRGTA